MTFLRVERQVVSPVEKKSEKNKWNAEKKQNREGKYYDHLPIYKTWHWYTSCKGP